jgi:hypothetical protein
MSCRTLYSLPLSITTVPSHGRRRASSLRGRLTLVILLGLSLFGVSRAEAGMITWHWAGPVTGYSGESCNPGFDCPTLDTVVPLGTNVDVFVTLDPAVPIPTYPTSSNCLWGTGSASLQVVGRTYTNQAFIWVDAFGFGGGICAPGSDRVEIVVPLWGSGGPALPDGWVPFINLGGMFFPGLWWGGDLTTAQPANISSQFFAFRIPDQSLPQRFIANLQAVPADLTPVPEPATITLFGAGLAAAWAARRRRGIKE